MPITLIVVWKFWLASFHFNSQTTCHDSRIKLYCSKSSCFVYMRESSLFSSLLWQYKHSRLWRGQGESLGLFLYKTGFIIISKLVYFITTIVINVSTTKTVTNDCYLFIFSFSFHPLSSQIFCLSFPSFSSSCYKDPTACEPLFLATMIATVENIIK